MQPPLTVNAVYFLNTTLHVVTHTNCNHYHHQNQQPQHKPQSGTLGTIGSEEPPKQFRQWPKATLLGLPLTFMVLEAATSSKILLDL